jgi:aminodeoxyfutalosine deaminase
MALEGREMGVVALGLGGSEAEFPPELFAESFERAHQAGMHSVPHAGEISGPESVWAAINLLHADRLGHGIRSSEDPALLEYLHEKQIPLEVCPTSNVALRVYDDYAHHPLRTLWDMGLLNQEYQVLVEQFEFSMEELEKISLNALHASFLSQAEKAAMEEEFQREFKQLKHN